MTIAVVILNYNSAADCRRCVADLKKQRGVEFSIIVVDNASDGADRDEMRRFCQDSGCVFIANIENRGYNAGNNVGLRYAAEHGCEYALIANPDMRFPQDDYLAKSLSAMRKDATIAVLGTDIIHNAGWHQNPMAPDAAWPMEAWESLIMPLRMLLRRVPPKGTQLDHTRSGYCEKLSGCCLYLRMDFLREIGFLDEHLFLYSEEPVLAAQVRLGQRKMFYLAECQALHHHIATRKGDAIKNMRLFHRSRAYYLKHYSGFPGHVLWWLLPLKRFSWWITDGMLRAHRALSAKPTISKDKNGRPD